MLTAVLDACVLVPISLADTLLTFADAGLFQPLWSDLILVEVKRTMTGKLGMPEDRVTARLDQMNQAFPGATVTGFEHLIPSMTNHPKDRHVLAAAIEGGASTIVTANITDFPSRATDPYGVRADPRRVSQKSTGRCTGCRAQIFERSEKQICEASSFNRRVLYHIVQDRSFLREIG